MNFTYRGYSDLIELLKKSNYQFRNYDNWKEDFCNDAISDVVIMRHDIDFSIDKAVALAKLEKSMGIRTTYFVLLTSDFYNVFSKSSTEQLKTIIGMGHEVGLHFDEMRYDDLQGNEDRVRRTIIREADILSNIIGKLVTKVSYHRPSRVMMNANLEIPGIINSYSKEFFYEFKYLSDSRRCWREPIWEIIFSKKFHKLHILTHAFWYGEEDKDIHDSLLEFVKAGSKERYINLSKNIRDCEQFLKGEEI